MMDRLPDELAAAVIAAAHPGAHLPASSAVWARLARGNHAPESVPVAWALCLVAQSDISIMARRPKNRKVVAHRHSVERNLFPHTRGLDTPATWLMKRLVFGLLERESLQASLSPKLPATALEVPPHPLESPAVLDYLLSPHRFRQRRVADQPLNEVVAEWDAPALPTNGREFNARWAVTPSAHLAANLAPPALRPVPEALQLPGLFLYTSRLDLFEATVRRLLAVVPTLATARAPLAVWMRLGLDDRVCMRRILNLAPRTEFRATDVTLLMYWALVAAMEGQVQAIEFLVREAGLDSVELTKWLGFHAPTIVLFGGLVQFSAADRVMPMWHWLVAHGYKYPESPLDPLTELIVNAAEYQTIRVLFLEHDLPTIRAMEDHEERRTRYKPLRELLITLLVLGICGTGKSTTLNLLGAEGAHVGHTHTADTLETHIYTVELENHIFQLVDTRGFADTYKVDDKGTFTGILKTLADKGVDEIHGIFWLNNYSCRMQSDLQETAALIKSFADYTDHDLTQNVVVLYRDSYKRGPYGAVEAIAAALGCSSDKIARHFMYIDDESIPNIGHYTRADAQAFLRKLATETRDPVRVVHRYKRCTKCSAHGDPRLCGPECHPAFEEVHRGRVTYKHTGVKFKRHSKEGYAVHGDDEFVHRGAAETPVHAGTERKHGNTRGFHETEEKMHPGFKCFVATPKTVTIAFVSFPISDHRNISYCTKCTKDENSPGCLNTCCENVQPCRHECKVCEQDVEFAPGCMMACCDGAKDVPCTFAHACCGALVTSKDTGCIKICADCNEDPNKATGCKMSCCKGTEGCIEVWSCCDQLADKTECTRATYTECGHAMTDDPCWVRCRNCHGTKGKSEGCTLPKGAAGHEFVDDLSS
ncbi:hypothetical protein BC828DRAFT_412250 [Blastocladiella britannica]|nr:hypothetical protein BC828DRAFT_412250 [Blastocladiella britannica]